MRLNYTVRRSLELRREGKTKVVSGQRGQWTVCPYKVIPTHPPTNINTCHKFYQCCSFPETKKKCSYLSLKKRFSIIRLPSLQKFRAFQSPSSRPTATLHGRKLSLLSPQDEIFEVDFNKKHESLSDISPFIKDRIEILYTKTGLLTSLSLDDLRDLKKKNIVDIEIIAGI